MKGEKNVDKTKRNEQERRKLRPCKVTKGDFMKRVLLDTSVYGRFVEEPETVDAVMKKIPKQIVVYGSDTIKKEIRDTPKYVKHAGKNLRILLLSIYKTLIKDHELISNKLVEILSSDYFREYIKLGGSRSAKAMKNDFMIISTATIYKLDIVVSDDEKTMLSSLAIRTYKSVNKKYGLPDPKFIPYRKFRSAIKNQEDFPV